MSLSKRKPSSTHVSAPKHPKPNPTPLTTKKQAIGSQTTSNKIVKKTIGKEVIVSSPIHSVSLSDDSESESEFDLNREYSDDEVDVKEELEEEGDYEKEHDEVNLDSRHENKMDESEELNELEGVASEVDRPKRPSKNALDRKAAKLALKETQKSRKMKKKNFVFVDQIKLILTLPVTQMAAPELQVKISQTLEAVKGKLGEIAVSQEASRAIQLCCKYGTKENRRLIFEDFKGMEFCFFCLKGRQIFVFESGSFWVSCSTKTVEIW